MENSIDEINNLNRELQDLKIRIVKLEERKCGVCNEELEGKNSIICHECLCQCFEEKSYK